MYVCYAQVDRVTAKVKVSLTFDQVNTTHFQKYVLRARNDLGERHFNAVLSLGKWREESGPSSNSRGWKREFSSNYREEVWS